MHIRPTTRPCSVPGPRPTPILGGVGNLIRWMDDPIAYLDRAFAAHGPLIALAAGARPRLTSPFSGGPGIYFVYGPELVRQVAAQHELYAKYAPTGSHYPMGQTSPRKAPLKHLMTGLFHVNGEEHRQHRRLMLPAFHRRQIESYRDVMVELTEQLFATWRPGEQRDIYADLVLLTLRIATTTLFGTSLPDSGAALGQAMHAWTKLMVSPAMLLPYDLPGLPYRRWLDLAHRLDRDLRALVAQRLQSPQGDDVLSMLIAARDEESGLRLSEDELIGHIGLLFFAGHETSANALAWTLLLLTQHPAIAADLLDELEGALGGSPPSIEQLRALPLLDRVVKESLRILPPAPFTTRINLRPTELGGYELPMGAEVFLSIYHTHRMPELYPDPLRFNPDRFVTWGPSTYEYVPFSAGPRMCIGASFAQLEIKLVLAMLLQRFRLQLVPTTRVDRAVGITMAPKHGLPMRVLLQDRNFARGAGAVRGNVCEMVDFITPRQSV